MNKEECIRQLSETGRSFGTAISDVSVILSVEGDHIMVSTSTGAIEHCNLPDIGNDQLAHFSFDSWDTVSQVLTGRLPLATAFLDGKIRSNGYLTHIFPVMAMFQRGRPQDAPS